MIHRGSYRSKGGLMRTVVIALAAIAVLASPAYSQSRGGKAGGGKNAQAEQLAEERKRDHAENEKAYQSAVGRIPEKKVKHDPWGSLR